MKTIKTQCTSCGGTGLYEGMCEKPHEPVICLSCDGTGCETISYEPYTGRKAKRGVKAGQTLSKPRAMRLCSSQRMG